MLRGEDRKVGGSFPTGSIWVIEPIWWSGNGGKKEERQKKKKEDRGERKNRTEEKKGRKKKKRRGRFSWLSDGRISTVLELKSIHTTRAMREYQNLGVSSNSKR